VTPVTTNELITLMKIEILILPIIIMSKAKLASQYIFIFKPDDVRVESILVSLSFNG
jgi:hypothetical protein